MADPNETAKTSWPWGRIVLVLSLALNLLVVGVFLGAALSGKGGLRGDRGDRAAARELGPLPFVAALEFDERRELARALRGAAEPLQQNREELRARFEALLEALRSPEFDRAAVSALIAEQRGLAVTRQQMGEAILLDHIEGMTLEERLGYADRLDKSLRRGPRRP